MRILLIEDKKKTAGFLAKGLREDGLTVEIAHDGESGLDLARTKKFDLLIVDVMLPNKDGWAVVTELRKSGMRTPILFLTARDSVRDRAPRWTIRSSRNSSTLCAARAMSSRPAEPRSIASQLVLLFTLAAAFLLSCGLGALYWIVVQHAFEEDNEVLADKVAAVRADLSAP